mmetsp:Transcript_1134/g.845  ORF Transcript_1134/g.845 Transcript_1134/m.845 type:complete len:98 (-) Transcript_1134:870-1163(-)
MSNAFSLALKNRLQGSPITSPEGSEGEEVPEEREQVAEKLAIKFTKGEEDKLPIVAIKSVKEGEEAPEGWEEIPGTLDETGAMVKLFIKREEVGETF